MNKYIKYERFEKICDTPDQIQELFDYLITIGYEMISYNEIKKTHDNVRFFFIVTIVAGKLKTKL